MMVAMLVALALLAAPHQSDLESWIQKLGDESIEVREKATRHLQDVKPIELAALRKAMESAVNPEIKARLTQILDHHRKVAEFAQVFGPAIRYTKSGKGLKLADVLQDLASLAGPSLEFEPVDAAKTIDIDLANVTWWEAMDRCAAAAGMRYAFSEPRKDKKPRVRWSPARAPEGPVLYAEQFRVSIHSARRFEFRTLGMRSEIGFIQVCVNGQPGLRPVRPGLSDGVQVFVKNANGAQATSEEPRWLDGIGWSSRFDTAHYGYSWVVADAPAPLTVFGTARIQFAKDPQIVTIDLDGDKGEIKRGPATFRITSFTQSKAQSKLTLTVHSEETIELFERMVEESVVVEDAEGGRHPGRMGFSGRTLDDSTEWEFEFRRTIKDPKKVEFRWIAEFHTVEIPFSFDGVRLP